MLATTLMLAAQPATTTATGLAQWAVEVSIVALAAMIGVAVDYARTYLYLRRRRAAQLQRIKVKPQQHQL